MGCLATRLRDYSRIESHPSGDYACALSMTGGRRTRARASPCVHRASNNEERTTVVSGHRALALLKGGSISTGLGMLRREKLFRGLRRGQTQALAQIIVEAWPHEQTTHRISSSLGDGGLLGGAIRRIPRISCSRPRVHGERIVPEELAHGLSVRFHCSPWPADERWPSALVRHFE